MSNWKTSIRKALPKGVVKQLNYVYRVFRALSTKGKISKYLKANNQVKLEIGSGDKYGTNGWITLDTSVKCDLTWDLKNGIPFPSDSVDIIYSSHLFEHLHYKHILSLLKECKRVLKPGGVFSICVPNVRLYIDAYVANDTRFWKMQGPVYEPGFFDTQSPVDYINYVVYMDDEHRYMFDEKNMIAILSQFFSDAKIRDFDGSVDMAERKVYSLYAQAVKR